MAGTENTKASELLNTHGGVGDIYGSACARKLEVQQEARESFIQTVIQGV